MVAHLLTLRLLLLKNTLLRSKWQLVAVIIGALYGGGVLLGAIGGLFALSALPIELVRTVIVLAGSALIAGWIVIPLLLTGIDQALDASMLVTFPIARSQLLVGLTVAAIVGVPGLVTLLASMATALTWWRSPFIALVALVCGVVATLTCVVASRALTTLSLTFSRGRRLREVLTLLAFAPLVLLGPIVISIGSGIQESLSSLPGIAEILSWTPIGAVWAVASELAAGHVAAAAIKLLIALLTLALLVVLWRQSLAIALVTPSRKVARTRSSGRLGLFAWVPATPAGAVMARSLTYWMRDPRYVRQLLVVPLLPALLYFYSRIGVTDIMVVSGVFVAFVLSLSIFSDISFDGTAFSTEVATGISGRDDRAGRAAALASFGLPLAILVTVGSVWASDQWMHLPALLGLTIGIFLSGLGLSSVTSARLVLPVPAAGENPFKAAPGASLTGTLTTFATWAVLWILVLPELVIAILAAVYSSLLLGWVALLVGCVLGSIWLILGIRIGGKRLDVTAPILLQQLARQR